MANEPKKKTNQGAKKAAPKKTTQSNKPTPKKSVTTEPKITKESSFTEQSTNKPVNKKIDYQMILITVIALLIIIFAFIKISGCFDNKDYSKSYLLKNKIITNEIDSNNINNIQLKDQFIFITTLNNEEEYQLEKDLKKVIKDNNLKDQFYIYIVNDNDNITNMFNLNKDVKVPTILYYKNGELIDMVQRDDEKMIEAGDFSKLLDMYELSKEE